MAATWLVVVTCVLAMCDASFVFPSDEDVMPGVRTRLIPSPREDQPDGPVDGAFTPIFFPGNQPDDTVELPDDLEELDFNSLALLNNISSILDFAQLFDLELPSNEENAELGLTVRSGVAAAEMPDLAKMANCKPELRTVELDLPVQAHTTFYPTCVRLERCGGCCFGPLLECTPTRSEIVKLQVLKTSSSRSVGSTRRGGRRRRGDRSASYHVVDVVRHMACECGCKVKAEDCNDTIHNYKEGECACVCKDRDEKRKCEQQAGTMYWSDETCSCYCRKPLICGSGEIFNQNTCRCEQVTGRFGNAAFADEEFNFTPARRRPIWRRRKPVREW